MDTELNVHQTNSNKNKYAILLVIIGLAIAAAIIVGAVIVPTIINNNQSISSIMARLEDNMYTEVRDGYTAYYLSAPMESEQRRLQELSASFFTSKSNRKEGQNLLSRINFYKAMQNAENNFYDMKYKTAQNCVDSASNMIYSDNKWCKDLSEQIHEKMSEMLTFEAVEREMYKIMAEKGVTATYHDSDIQKAQYSKIGVCGRLTAIDNFGTYTFYIETPDGQVASYPRYPSEGNKLGQLASNKNNEIFACMVFYNDKGSFYSSHYDERLNATPSEYKDYTGDWWQSLSNNSNGTQRTSDTSNSDDYIFPSDTQYITEDFLSSLTQKEVAYVRNEIYARHGYVFNNQEYADYFSQKDWYSPNESFNDSMLNDIEKENRDIIVAYEKRMGW